MSLKMEHLRERNLAWTGVDETGRNISSIISNIVAKTRSLSLSLSLLLPPPSLALSVVVMAPLRSTKGSVILHRRVLIGHFVIVTAGEIVE